MKYKQAAERYKNALEQIATGKIVGEPHNHKDTVEVMRSIAKEALSQNIEHPTSSAEQYKKFDWCNLEAVKEYARKLGHGLWVVRYPSRNNYNIVFKCHSERCRGAEILFET